jgi:hypothetical protein
MTPDQVRRVMKSLEEVRDVAGANAQLAGHVAVLTCAVGALVQTHPDPAAFAQTMRQAWQQFGMPNQDEQTSPKTQAGIDQALSVLEDLCVAPLNIRPPP